MNVAAHDTHLYHSRVLMIVNQVLYLVALIKRTLFLGAPPSTIMIGIAHRPRYWMVLGTTVTSHKEISALSRFSPLRTALKERVLVVAWLLPLTNELSGWKHGDPLHSSLFCFLDVELCCSISMGVKKDHDEEVTQGCDSTRVLITKVNARPSDFSQGLKWLWVESFEKKTIPDAWLCTSYWQNV